MRIGEFLYGAFLIFMIVIAGVGFVLTLLTLIASLVTGQAPS